MPTFDDTPVHVVPAKGSLPPTPDTGDQSDPYADLPEDGAIMKHAQYNSPLQMYGDNALTDTVEAQTGGRVTVQRQK